MSRERMDKNNPFVLILLSAVRRFCPWTMSAGGREPEPLSRVRGERGFRVAQRRACERRCACRRNGRGAGWGAGLFTLLAPFGSMPYCMHSWRRGAIETLRPRAARIEGSRRPISNLHVGSAALMALCTLCSAVAFASPAEEARLHVASPDWRDQVIYFLMIDRFDDGDPSNNDQGAGEFDPSDPRKYSGGDLRGVTRRLDYIKELGATAVWITPPVANQWWDGQLGYGGYHGYWAEHFSRVDAHYGSLDDYKALSAALHARDMYLIQDVVVNHTGNFFSYREGWDADDPVRFYTPNPDSHPVAAPRQWPFSLNDPRDPAQREASIYHWTPTIRDFSDHRQEQDFALADLDDLNTENAVVRRALRDSYGYWIREVGVDAFRVDTAYHVPPDYFRDFLYSGDAEHPGIKQVARGTGREDFLSFGEGFGTDRAFADEKARKLESYVRSAEGEPLLDTMIDFPLYGSLSDVFSRGRPPAELGHRVTRRMALHADPHRMPTFIDNHDVDRFLAGGSEAGLKQALLALMTLPGIPTIYYGTEQGFTQPRRAMFASGYASGGRDHFDTDAPLFRYLQRVIALRRDNRLLSRGVPSVLHANVAAAGALVWRIEHQGEALFVVLNSADRETLLDNLETGLPGGSRLDASFSIAAAPESMIVDAHGRISLRLPARAGWVLRASSVPIRSESQPAAASITLRQSDNPTSPPNSITLEGEAPSASPFLLVLDGDLARAQSVAPAADGRWRASIDTASLVDPEIEHRLVAWLEHPPTASAALSFKSEPQWALLAETSDPAGDDHGPDARYVYPSDASWGDHRQADLRAARVFGTGGSLRIELDMASITAGWNPPNGFDHVAFTIFIELPEHEGGARVMPLQNAQLPGGMRWHYRLRAGGWSNALFTAESASASQEGTPLSAAAQIAVERDARRISFTLPASAIGSPRTLSGARILVSTWDYDGRYRDLLSKPGSHAFGGGDSRSDPLQMDEVILRIP